MSDRNKDLRTSIRKWLAKEGYPLEMSVARCFSDAGFDVSISATYEDYETRQEREIDVSASRWTDLNKPLALQVCFMVECKVSKDKPVVAFFSEAQPQTTYVPSNVITSPSYRTFLMKTLKPQDHRDLLWKFPNLVSRPAAYGVTQAFTNGPDMPYQAVTVAVKASIDRVLKMEKFNAMRPTGESPIALSVVFPMIVIDGVLFRCYLGADEELDVEQMGSTVVYWARSNPLSTSPLVSVVTRDELESIVKQAKEATDALLAFTTEHLDEL